jgi:hypothetical protein
MATRAHIAAACAAVLLLTLHAAPAAGEPKPLAPDLAVEKGTVTATFAIPSILDADLRGRVSSGLTSQIIVSAWLESADGQWKGHESLVNLQAVYDVWEEHYVLKRDDLRGSRTRQIKDQAAFLDALVRIESVPLAGKALLDPAKSYVVRVTVSVNPPSRQLIEKAREYLSDPEGYKRLSTSRTAFGSFARTFIPAAIGEAGAVSQFVSRPFSPASLPPDAPAAPGGAK